VPLSLIPAVSATEYWPTLDETGALCDHLSMAVDGVKPVQVAI
jgi:hypothetical protein